MDKTIFENICKYMEVHRVLTSGSVSKEKLLEALKENGVPATTANRRVAECLGGDALYISTKDNMITVDTYGLSTAIKELEVALGIKESPPMSRKKPKPEDAIATVTEAHSPKFEEMKKKADEAIAKEKQLYGEIEAKEKEIRRLEKLLEERLDDLVAQYVVSKTLTLDSVKPKPAEQFKKDFFLLNPESVLPIADMVSRYGGTIESPYAAVFASEKELVEENYFRRVMRCLFGGSLLKDCLKDQEALKPVHKSAEARLNRTEINQVELEQNRLTSIKEILDMDDVFNQVKLSLYAAWLPGDDSEMLELLQFAGKYGINANYLIRLLEKPKEYRNYRTLRGMLQQAREASEFHIKREAALELISGDWYVEAEYMGKPCKFVMAPVNEMESFLALLKAHDTKHAVNVLEHLISDKRKAAICLKDSKEVIEVTNESVSKKTKKSAKKKEIPTPVFLHANDVGIDMHPEINEDAAFDGFEEMEVEHEQ